MLADLASLDHILASNLWRVRNELTDEELHWLDFTCASVELEPGSADKEVTEENKCDYVRLSCKALLRQFCGEGMRAFADGFLEVVPARLLDHIPEEGVLQMLIGKAEVTDGQLEELEQSVLPSGLVPTKLRDDVTVREAAGWFFQAVRAGDGAFRARLLEFWIGMGRVPLTGLSTVRPRPRLQVMVQPDTPTGGVKRIASWPRERLPEGHTCGNELWIALPDSYEDLASRLQLAVDNFEAGFSLR